MDIAATYDNAITALTTEHYDVAFVDYWLGARDGVALMADVRARGIDTPIVILTACGAEDVAVKAMKAGAADYLPKTQVSVEALDRAIRHAAGAATTELAAESGRTCAARERGALPGTRREQLGRVAAGRRRGAGSSIHGALVGASFSDGRPTRSSAVRCSTSSTRKTAIRSAGAMSGPLAGAGDSTTVEIRVQHADGGYRTLEAVAVNHIDDPGGRRHCRQRPRHHGAAAPRGAAAAFAKDGSARSAGRRRCRTTSRTC